MRRAVIMLTLAIALTSCGRKEPPQVVDLRKMPEIASLEHTVSGNSLKLILRLQGGADGIGFQVDRTEQDPGCKCPGFWRRYFEAPPSTRQKGEPITKLFNLRSHKHIYYFRVRAIDGLGRLGPWSETIFAQAEVMLE